MDVPTWLVLVLVNLLLVAGGLIVFLPDNVPPLRHKDARRILDKYGKYLLAAIAVLPLHLFILRVDPLLTERLGWDFAPLVSSIERDVVLNLSALWNPFTDLVLSIVYIIVHPWMLYFPIVLFLLSDEERPAKATLLIYPLAYLLVLPFYLLLPLTNVFTHHDVQSPVFELFPGLVEIYYNFTTPDNTFPSLHVAISLLIANAARYSRNRNYRYFAYAYAPTVILATLYLNIHWIADVLGGALVAVAVGTFTRRFISTERLALQRVKPTPEEAQRVRDAADGLVQRVGAETSVLGLPADAMLVGSVAKDTYLRDSVDFDVFVLFPVDVPREALQDAGLRVGRAVLDDPEEKYAEHPYTHGLWQAYDADVVPCYAVAEASQRISAVDRTPFHTRFVADRMSREQRDQVRLLKAFMKGVGVYGAESRTQGFSGYLCELLVLKYGTFRAVVDAAASWKPGTFLILDKIDGTPKFADPLTFLDPTDTRRNVASAVSAETLAHFAEACRAYERRESLAFFFPRQLVPLPPDELATALRRRRADYALVRTKAPAVLEDHLHDQARKAIGGMTKLLERHGFEVRRASYDITQELLVLLELARLRLPETVTHTGPPVKSREHADRFRRTWGEHRDARSPVYEEDGRLKVERVREHRRADDLLRAKLLEYDLGKHLNESMREGFEVLAGLDVVQEDTARLVTKHLNRRKSWEL